MVVGVALAALYLVGVQRVRRPWPASRTLSFVAGCVALVFSSFTTSSSFTGHMLEHVMIGMVGPNVSSRMMRIEWSTPASTVGS